MDMDDQDSQYDVSQLFGGGGCEDALHTLYDYLDGELTDERRQTIRRHLDECEPCLHAFDFEAELKIVIARSCQDQVPTNLRAKIAQALASAEGKEPSGTDRGSV
jgi:mycothiol system anti-sigma-R factor